MPHLWILGCCIYSLTTRDPKTGEKTLIDDIQEVRCVCHEFQSKVYAPGNIFTHDWQQGDLVLFHNRGIIHSISGQLSTYPRETITIAM
jgi:alpha-ketoglutarate-dependent taurine dioxygenase